MADPAGAWLPLTFPVLWLAGSALVSHVGGWAALARRFRATTAPPGVRGWVSGWVGPLMRYNGVLRVATPPHGLFLGVSWAFKFQHPDLLVPWEEVRRVEHAPGFFSDQTLLELGPAGTRVWLDGPVGAEVLRAYQAARGGRPGTGTPPPG